MSQLCCSRNLWIQPNCQLQALYLQVLQHQMAYLLTHLAFVEGWGEVAVLCLTDGIHLAIHSLSAVILYMFHQRLDILHINDMISTSWACCSIPLKVVYVVWYLHGAIDGRGNFEPVIIEEPSPGDARTDLINLLKANVIEWMLRASFCRNGLPFGFVFGQVQGVPFSLFLA